MVIYVLSNSYSTFFCNWCSAKQLGEMGLVKSSLMRYLDTQLHWSPFFYLVSGVGVIFFFLVTFSVYLLVNFSSRFWLDSHCCFWAPVTAELSWSCCSCETWAVFSTPLSANLSLVFLSFWSSPVCSISCIYWDWEMALFCHPVLYFINRETLLYVSCNASTFSTFMD